MVYSTCTLEPEEDEGVVSYLLEQFPSAKLQDIELPIKRSPPVTSFKEHVFHPDVRKCLRIWPQDNNTEGFFLAKFKNFLNFGQFRDFFLDYFLNYHQ